MSCFCPGAQAAEPAEAPKRHFALPQDCRHVVTPMMTHALLFPSLDEGGDGDRMKDLGRSDGVGRLPLSWPAALVRCE
jgi:hypothetical protein